VLFDAVSASGSATCGRPIWPWHAIALEWALSRAIHRQQLA
jgi:hypothetical protein